MALLILFVFGAVLMWLRIYTNHGQKLALTNYVGDRYVEAAVHAEKESFQLIVKDSIHKVGQPGGIIIAQNPKGGAEVKEKRKIYVDVTKYQADTYDVTELPPMYGNEYNSIVTTLGTLNINSNILGHKHDPGEPNHILEVHYNGRPIITSAGRKSNVKIEKGGTLGFVLSKLDGGEVQVPELVCRTYGQVGFIIATYRLKLGPIEQSGAITDRASAYVIGQNPPYSQGATMSMGQEVLLTIQQEKPESCP